MNALVIATTQIRRDAAGRYCLNDLHRASGGAAKNPPAKWVALNSTQELIAEIANVAINSPNSESYAPLEATIGRPGGGTYAVKELVYAYAMWISAEFHVHVVRAYDAMVQAVHAKSTPDRIGPSHYADVLVGAKRAFDVLVCVGETMGQGHMQAVRAANDAIARDTGVDLAEKMGAAELIAHDDGPCALVQDDGVARFHRELQAGTIGAPYQPCLSRDAYSLYQHWCGQLGIDALIMPQFLHRLCSKHCVKIARRRYAHAGTVHGPVSIVVWGKWPGVGKTERELLGESVRGFQDAVTRIVQGGVAA